ncbi:unnamed protein product [Rhizoctonia solani]|uniref:Uncharacterized protein n=1 Tax=Rhizoctonia solani TaxID=456999 RepID=A0A8H2X847_9AGAM|nr:unnamed protein product [Rhizoctonia solani]
MIPVPSSSQQPLKPILKRTGSSAVAKSVTFSATNSQVFFADDWDRSAVEVVSKLSYSDVLELKQLSLESLPSDRHASMGLSPLLSHVPLTLCPLTCEEPKNYNTSSTESRAAPPSSSSSEPKVSPLVVPDLSILGSSAVSCALPPPPLSPVSSDAGSSVSLSLGSVSPRTTSDSSPESTPPKISVQLSAPVPVRRQLMMNFQPLLPEPGAELPPSPVLSASSLSDSSTDTGKTLSILLTKEPITPTTPHTPHTPSQLSPIPASPISPTSFAFGPAPSQGSTPNKSRSLRAADSARSSALFGPRSGDLGLSPPPKSAAGNVSPVSPISPAASDATVSGASGLVRPVPRRAYTPVSDVSPLTPSPQTSVARRASVSSASAPDVDPVQRTKGSRGFDESRGAKPLAIAATAWVDGALPSHKEEPETSIPTPIEPNLRSVPLPHDPTPPRSLQRSNSSSESQSRSFKYTNPYSQIRENDEPTSVVETTSRLHTRRASSDRPVQLTRDLSVVSVKSTSLPAVPQVREDSLGLSVAPRARPPPVSMSRPAPIHRASVHGYPLGPNRPPSPTPQAFSRGYPSPLSPNPPLLSHQQSQPQPRSGKPLAAKDANANRPSFEPRATSYTLSDSTKGSNSFDRKPRSVTDLHPMAPPAAIATYSTPLTRPRNSRVSR